MKEDYIKGMNKKTYDLLFKDENLSNSENINTSSNDSILDKIEKFTSLNNVILRKVAEKMFHISYDKKEREYIYNKNGREIPFNIFSDFILDKEVKRELLSYKRKIKCHLKVIQFIDYFKNPVSILTGTYEKHGNRFLHSVIEMESKTGNYIIDYTMNLIMRKEIYIELTQFKLIEKIQDIEALEDERDGIWNFLSKNDLTLKPYLTFQKEIRRDLEKNNKMLEKVDDKKLEDRIEEMKKQREDIERS